MLFEDIFKSNYLKETELSAYNESFIHRITLTVGNEEQFDEIKKEKMVKGQSDARTQGSINFHVFLTLIFMFPLFLGSPYVSRMEVYVV